MSKKVRIGRLCVITDTATQSRFSHEELAALAIDGGADTIQLRDKALSDADLTEVAKRVLEVCTHHDVPLIINDRVHLIGETGAHGVHVGLTDSPVADARASLGPDAIVGGTAGTIEVALAAQAAGADYIGVGHVFPTASKQKPGEPIGLDELARVCEAVRIPVLAIGGIDVTNARSCIEAGAHGIAVIAAVCAARDPRAATHDIRSSLP